MDALFGSQVRTDALVAIARLSTTYPSELAGVLGLRKNEIQRALASLERTGAINTRLIGRTRVIQLNSNFWGSDELYALLLKMSELPYYEERWRKLHRRRPRAMEKPP